MDWKSECKKLLAIIAVFIGCFYLPVEMLPFRNPLFEALALVKWYAREHVLLCLVPAFLIAGVANRNTAVFIIPGTDRFSRI